MPEPALGEEPFARRMAKVAQGFATHGRCQAMAEAGGQGEENQADIGAARGVIGDKQCGAAQGVEIFAAENFGMAKEQGRGPGERVIDEQAEQADWGALRPTRVDVIGAAGGGLRKELLEIGGGLRVGELCFVEFDVVATLEGGKELDAIKRGKVF